MNTADVPDRLLLDYRPDSGVTVVKVTGEVDVSTSSSLRNSLLRVITDENHHGLVVTLASVSFLDSTGLGVLVLAATLSAHVSAWLGVHDPACLGEQLAWGRGQLARTRGG